MTSSSAGGIGRAHFDSQVSWGRTSNIKMELAYRVTNRIVMWQSYSVSLNLHYIKNDTKCRPL